MIGDLDSRDYAENESRLQEVHGRLQALEHERRAVSGAEDLEALEREIRAETDRLANVLLERQVQANLDSAERQAAVDDRFAEVETTPIVAEGSPAATAPKATPTARPSGILCIVMASTSKVLRCQEVLTPSL